MVEREREGGGENEEQEKEGGGEGGRVGLLVVSLWILK